MRQQSSKFFRHARVRIGEREQVRAFAIVRLKDVHLAGQVDGQGEHRTDGRLVRVGVQTVPRVLLVVVPLGLVDADVKRVVVPLDSVGVEVGYRVLARRERPGERLEQVQRREVSGVSQARYLCMAAAGPLESNHTIIHGQHTTHFVSRCLMPREFQSKLTYSPVVVERQRLHAHFTRCLALPHAFGTYVPEAFEVVLQHVVGAVVPLAPLRFSLLGHVFEVIGHRGSVRSECPRLHVRRAFQLVLKERHKTFRRWHVG